MFSREYRMYRTPGIMVGSNNEPQIEVQFRAIDGCESSDIVMTMSGTSPLAKFLISDPDAEVVVSIQPKFNTASFRMGR